MEATFQKRISKSARPFLTIGRQIHWRPFLLTASMNTHLGLHIIRDSQQSINNLNKTKNMTKYLEQTGWLLNPHPDKRKGERSGMQSWIPGTRWYFDESRGTLSGEGMLVNGQLAETIVAHSKEVEPGFGAIVSSSKYWSFIGRLIDQGKINMEDLQEVLKQKEFEDAEIDEDTFDSQRHLFDQHKFRYRHWLTLDPPSEELVRKFEEEDRRKAILDEYAERTGEPR